MMLKFDHILLVGLVLGIVLAGPISCRRERGKSEIDRIVLVTFDTLRADHLSCYGYPRATSPFIDRLAAEGVRFLNTYAPMPTTVPSHASIFTSLYPIQMNVLKNGHRLDDSFITLAEVLRTAGYATAAFISTDQHFAQGNLLQGFDYVDQPDLDKDDLYRPADQQVSAVISWLEGINPDERIFLWLHFYDAHSPFMPPPAILDRFAGITEVEKKEFTRFLIDERHIEPEFFSLLPDDYLRDTIDMDRYGNKRGDDVETMVRIINAYDGEVRFLDTELERLFICFKQNGLDQKTLWVLTSDHGEGLGNHWWLEHSKYLYQEQIHVPLIFYGPGCIDSGKEREDITGLVDILPTIAGLIDLSLGEEIKDSQGVSLAPLLTARDAAYGAGVLSSRYAIAQRRHFNEPDTDDMISPDEGYEGEAFSIQNDRYKYILRTAAEDGFYDLRRDPYETDNQSGQGGKVEQELKEILIERIDYLKSTLRGQPETIGQEGIDKLRALGYLQ